MNSGNMDDLKASTKKLEALSLSLQEDVGLVKIDQTNLDIVTQVIKTAFDRSKLYLGALDVSIDSSFVAASDGSGSGGGLSVLAASFSYSSHSRSGLKLEKLKQSI